MIKSHYCGKISRKHIGTSVTVSGWVNKVRDLGGLVFVDLRDRFGMVQLNFSSYKGTKDVFKSFSLESVITARGVFLSVLKRPKRPMVAIA